MIEACSYRELPPSECILTMCDMTPPPPPPRPGSRGSIGMFSPSAISASMANTTQRVIADSAVLRKSVLEELTRLKNNRSIYLLPNSTERKLKALAKLLAEEEVELSSN